MPLLEDLLDSWDRANAILLNLLRTVPEGGLAARAMEGSPSVSEMVTHMHHERMVSVLEETPEFAKDVPGEEWAAEPDPDRIAEMLTESAELVRSAVRSRVETGRSMDLNLDAPRLLGADPRKSSLKRRCDMTLKAARAPVESGAINVLIGV